MNGNKKKKTINLDRLLARIMRISAILMTIAAMLVGGGAYTRMAARNFNKTIGDCNRLVNLGIDREQLKKVDDAVMDIYGRLDVGKIEDGDQSSYKAQIHAYEKEFEKVLDMPEYQYLREFTYQINRALENIQSIYFLDADMQNKRIIYLADGYVEEKSHYSYMPGTIDFISVRSMKIFSQEHDYKAALNYDSMRGLFYYDYQPIRDENGNIICYLGIDINIDEVITGHRWFLVMTLILMSAVAAFVTWGTIRSAKRGIAPIRELTQAARDYNYTYSKGDRITTKFFKGIDGGYVTEIQDLINSMRTMEIGLNVYMEKLATVSAERERINTELGIATRIQSAMLPCIFPAYPDREEFDIYATMDPAREVGGDFYDFFLIDEDHLGIVMADVSGKGVPAALFMMASKILISDRASTGGTPGEILEKVNDALCSNNQEDMFVTVWLGILDVTTGRLTYANAGHEHPAIRRNGCFELVVERHNFVLGGLEGMKFNTYERHLDPDDMIYLYTDGVAEASNADNELFGTDRMIEALNKYADGTPEEILRGVRSEVDEFVNKAPQFDDITMLCLHFKGKK